MIGGAGAAPLALATPEQQVKTRQALSGAWDRREPSRVERPHYATLAAKTTNMGQAGARPRSS
jgi:hypothetical protein